MTYRKKRSTAVVEYALSFQIAKTTNRTLTA